MKIAIAAMTPTVASLLSGPSSLMRSLSRDGCVVTSGVNQPRATNSSSQRLARRRCTPARSFKTSCAGITPSVASDVGDRRKELSLVALRLGVGWRMRIRERFIVIRLHRDDAAPRQVEQGRIESERPHPTSRQRARERWSQIIRRIELRISGGVGGFLRQRGCERSETMSARMSSPASVINGQPARKSASAGQALAAVGQTSGRGRWRRDPPRCLPLSSHPAGVAA